MIIKVFQSARIDLKPDVIHKDAWHLSVSTQDETTEIKIYEDHGKLTISVDHQLVIEPHASNAINVFERNF